MKIYKISGSMILIVVLLVFAGCSSTKEVAQTNKRLAMCIDEYTNDTYKEGFEEFKKTYPDVELDIEVYTDILQGMAQVNTQIMAGEGPDLLLMSSGYGTADVYKMIKAQAFAPLDEFIGQDEGWDAGDYAEAVLEAGIYEGRQLVMPLSYLVQVAVTSEENLEKAGIAWDSCNDMASFLQETAKFYEFDSAERVLGDVGRLTQYTSFLSDGFLDYSRRALRVDEQILREACRAYKSFYYEDAVESISLPKNGYFDIGGAIADGETCMVVPVDGFDFMEASQALAANAVPVLWPYKNGSGQVSAEIMDYAGIRANSENRQNAWNMLKILMGKTAQSRIAAQGQYCPVLKSVLEDAIDQTKEKAYKDGKSIVEMAELPKELLMQYKDALLNPEHAIFATNIAGREFLNYMKPFYEDESSYEDCIAEFKKFISIYLTE